MSQNSLWESAIQPSHLTSDVVHFGDVMNAKDHLYWIEKRPAEGGRSTIMQRDENGTTSEIIPNNTSVATAVNEYGGGDFTPIDDGVVYSNKKDQQLYFSKNGNKLTNNPGMRYSNGAYDKRRNALYIVGEKHNDNGKVITSLIRIDLKNGTETVLTSDCDFYAFPTLSQDGSKIAFVGWNLPNMPWDGSYLYVADLTPNGDIANTTQIAGSETTSIFQPIWNDKGDLFYISDESGYSNIYCYKDGKHDCIHEMDADFGWPLWQLNMSRFAVIDDEHIVALYQETGITRLGAIKLSTKQLFPIETPVSHFEQLRSCEKKLYFRAQFKDTPPAVCEYDLTTRKLKRIKESSKLDFGKEWISTAQPHTFPTKDGNKGHAFFYPPKNPKFSYHNGALPPAIIKIHGGPTAQTVPAFDTQIQFYTSRGFAFIDLNYGGSTGYGKAYRDRLNGKWGMIELEDAEAACHYFAISGLIDNKKWIIKGSSAGGYTVLRAAAQSKQFKAGVCAYGVADIEKLLDAMPKFESKYFDKLIGPYPKEKELYKKLSPINNVDKMEMPLLLFQGGKDCVVPPSQSEAIRDALIEKNIYVKYHLFPDEGHGFRAKESILKVLEEELKFYSKIIQTLI